MNMRADGFDAYLPENFIDQVILAADALARFRALELRERFSLTEIQYRLMLMAARHGPVNIGELASMVGRDRGQVSRTVKSLVERGWMTSVRLEKVATIEVSLSPEGWKAMREIAHVGQAWHGALGSPLSEPEIALLTRCIERLHASVGRAGQRVAVQTEDIAGRRACQAELARR